MNMDADTFWNMPIGLFMDLWACHRQFLGAEKPYKALTINDAIPEGVG
jgi:hypothetical protein